MLKTLIPFLFLLMALPASSQEKTLLAVKVIRPPRIDGSLDDSAWIDVPAATGFTQTYPSAGQPASQESRIRVVYDNSAIYVGAYLYDDPARIRRQLTARDDEQQKDVDYFSVFFDTYRDRQNGFQFVVTSANVQSDARLGPNLGGGGGFGDFGDKTWDAVWDSKVRIQTDGWTVEMRIPYISLRFAKRDLQDWGIQFLRQTRRNNENCYWNPVLPQVNGFVNQFGVYQGLKDLQPPLRLSFSPYVSGGFRRTPEIGQGFSGTWLGNGGMDVKYGVNESFTLDATLIPDFGQVISDNVINNLSPFEVRFQENRPFFTEGTELFNKAGLFYSRRVGAIPGKYQAVQRLAATDPQWQIVRNPSVTQLVNAAKFSGRNSRKLGIGVFNAVTASMEARLRKVSDGQDTLIETEPLANYNILVIDQALQGRSSVTFTNTNVIRNGSGRDANVSSFDFSLFDKKNLYNLRGTGRYSRIFAATPYDGYNGTLRFAKVSGNWQYFVQQAVVSARYDPRDLGFLLFSNNVSSSAALGYSWFTPTRHFLTYNYRISGRYTRLYKPGAYIDLNLEGSSFWVFRNFWDLSVRTGFTFPQHDYFVLGDPLTYRRFVIRPSFGYVRASGSTDSRKKGYLRGDLVLSRFFRSAPGKKYHLAEVGFRYRFSNRLTLDLSHRHEAETDFIIYAGRETTNEPIVAFVDFADISSVLSGIYNFTPRINLTLRARHYLSRVRFDRFANVDTRGHTLPRAGSTSYDNVNIFNVDAFLTWDYRLGSRLIVGYKNWLGDDASVLPSGKNNYLNNLGRTFGLRHGNEFTLRLIYFLDYDQLRRRTQ
ncbi:MAG: hypothetical protein RJA57_887 [Bacteroidota bacterium]|jgi:hypothetical protein